jgi:hypothetical protein
MSDKPHVETMAETWQRVKPATYKNGTDFCLRLGRVDTKCTFKLIDGGATIFFFGRVKLSDGGSQKQGRPTAVIGRGVRRSAL